MFTASVSAAGLVWTTATAGYEMSSSKRSTKTSVARNNRCGDLSDDSYQGTTRKIDFLASATVTKGAVSSIHLHNIGGAGIEIDHIQYVHNGMMGDLNRDGSRDALDQILLARLSAKTK